MVETIEELRSYREKVIAEVERRMMRIRAIETDIERAEFAAESHGRTQARLSRDTARNQAAEAHRKLLRERILSLKKERVQAEEDLQRANIRLDEVERRLSELGHGQDDDQ